MMKNENSMPPMKVRNVGFPGSLYCCCFFVFSCFRETMLYPWCDLTAAHARLMEGEEGREDEKEWYEKSPGAYAKSRKRTVRRTKSDDLESLAKSVSDLKEAGGANAPLEKSSSLEAFLWEQLFLFESTNLPNHRLMRELEKDSLSVVYA